MRKLLPVIVAALAVAPSARAGLVAMRVQDVPLGARSLAAVQPAIHFNMIAVHWRGSGRVEVRTHRQHGRWSAWQTADADVAPDGGTGSWHDGGIAWVGASDGVRFRVSGRVTALKAYEVWSRVTTAPIRSVSEASSPAIVSRAGWQANEEIVRARPVYAPTLKLAIVHHTDTTNDYTRAQAPAIVRGIEVYHVQGNGWNDIGYNFLVDRFGTVYEGRAGGIARNVVGAHAEGFNTGSVGVALLGTFTTATPSPQMQSALVDLLAWRLDVAHVDPLSTVTYVSGGNAKFRAGTVVHLRAISGHRDTGPSECPGAAAYALLPAIAKRVAATGLPKLYAPAVTGKPGLPVRFRARLSSALPWTVTIADAQGRTVATGKGQGAQVDWTWNAPPGKGGYTWTISAPGVRSAVGAIGAGARAPVPVPPAPPAVVTVSGLRVAPSFVAPVAGTPAPVTVSFSLSAPAAAQVQLVSPDGTSATLASPSLQAGPNVVRFDAGPLADGQYQVQVSAGASTVSAPLVVDRTLTGLAASASAISPNADGVDDSVVYTFTLSQPTPVTLSVEQNGATVATPYSGVLPAGSATISWDGTGPAGRLPDGSYVAVITTTDAFGELSRQLPIAVDTVPPVLTSTDPASLVFTLSEPATLTISINGDTTPFVLPEPAGTFTVPFVGAVTSVSAFATDAAGNKSAVVSG